MSAYLYLYESADGKTVYIGIATSMERVWQQHNADAEMVRDGPDSVILQTVEPFSTREDALKAEAVAIHVATLAGRTVLVASDDVDPELEFAERESFITVNRAGRQSTRVLGPAILRRDGSVSFEDLRRTAVVPISAGSMDGRPSPYGGTSGAVFSDRARMYWRVAAAKHHLIERLIAVLKASGGVIVGDWDVIPGGHYGVNADVFPLVSPEVDDPRGIKGMRLIGDYRLQMSRIYSNDLRA